MSSMYTMRLGVSGLAALCACTLCLPPHLAAASTATEVSPGTLDAVSTDTPETQPEPGKQSQALELPLMALMSFRDAGRPTVQTQPAPLDGLEPAARQIATQLATVSLPGSGFPYWGEEPDNQAHTQLLPYASTRSIMTSTPWGGETLEWEPRFKVDIDGSIAIGTGSATYADHEYQEFELNELLTTRSGKEYGFSQRYDVDHSYVNRGRLELGASQYFPALLWNGDLELEATYSHYQDRNTAANDYRQGEFELRFTPQWDAGATELEAQYKYRVRDYDEFSPRSYKRHEGLLRLQREFNPQFTGEAYAHLTDYNYSYGSSSDNSRTATGGALEWEPDDTWEARLAIDNVQKTYSASSYRDYAQLSMEGQVEFTPDADNRIRAEGEWRDYQRDNAPASSYNVTSIGLDWQRALTDRLEVELRLKERQKEYDTNTASDYDTHSWEAGFDYYPVADLNLYGAYGQDEYDYVTATRAFSRTTSELGARYGRGDWELRADWRRTENTYAQQAGRDYTRDNYDIEGNWRFDCQRVRVYYGIGRLAQADPESYNEYDETRYGAQWDYELDCQTELTLRYDFNERANDYWGGLEDTRFEARLNFEL